MAINSSGVDKHNCGKILSGITVLLTLLGLAAGTASGSDPVTPTNPPGQAWTENAAQSGPPNAIVPEFPFELKLPEPGLLAQIDSSMIQLADESGGQIIVTAQNAAGSSATSPAEGGAEPDLGLAGMAQKANNPLSDVWLLLTQNDTTLIGGDLVDDHQVVNNLKLQPVMPVPVFDQQWNLIFRPVLQLISSPLPTDRTTGLGDSVLLTLLGPNRDDGFIWGAGVTQIYPTATEDELGQGKWQAGPAALAVRLGNESGGLGIENWNIGALVQHWWSYAGDSDREGTNQTDIQYFINWRLNDTQLIGMTPNIQIDWDADSDNRVAFPIGLGTIGMFRIGRLPFRWGVEAQYYVIQPDDVAPEWNFRVFLSPIILNPFK